jgi:hypothetical protein
MSAIVQEQVSVEWIAVPPYANNRVLMELAQDQILVTAQEVDTLAFYVKSRFVNPDVRMEEHVWAPIHVIAQLRPNEKVVCWVTMEHFVNFLSVILFAKTVEHALDQINALVTRLDTQEHCASMMKMSASEQIVHVT